MKVTFDVDHKGVRTSQIFAKSLHEEIAVARLIASVQAELDALDQAIQKHWASVTPHRPRKAPRRAHLALVSTET